MAKLSIKAGTTSKILLLFIQDTSSTTGAGLTGLTNASSGLTAYYCRDTDTGATSISVVSMTLGTFTSGGFKEVSSANMPGVYQFCPPDAAIASGAKSVAILIKGVTNMAQLPLEIELTAVDNQDAVRMGMTALPNAAAEAAGGLYTRGTGAGQIKQTNNGEIDANATHINNVATTSVTTINANQGTTQPVNFTGTGASALAKSDMVDIAGAAVSASTAQIGANVVNWNGSAVATPNTAGVPKVDATLWLGGTIPAPSTTGVPKVDPVLWLGGAIATPNVTGVPKVDITHFKGTASAGTAGYAGIDWSAINAPTTSVALSNTTIALTAASITSAVWSDSTSYGAGTKGALLVSAGAAGDPWNTAQPGTYAAGTFGYLIANTMAGQLARSVGLNGENSVLQDVVYDAYGNVLSGTVRLYDSAANATTNNGVTGLVAEYDIANTIAANVLSESLQTRTA